jgi:hypothetical protein
VKGHQFLLSRPPLPEAGPLPTDLASSVSEAPEADENQDGDDAEESEEGTSSSTLPPPMRSEDTGMDKRRKRVDKFASSSSSLQKAFSQGLLKRFVALGTEYAEYLRVAKAFEGILDIQSLLFFYAYPLLFT